MRFFGKFADLCPLGLPSVSLSFVAASLLIALVSLAGCVAEYDYEYFDLRASMDVLQSGMTSLRVRRHEPMPIRYVRVGRGYELRAEVDTASTRPTIIFVAQGIDGTYLSLSLEARICHVNESFIRSFELKQRSIPSTALRLQWNWNNEKFCTQHSMRENNGEVAIIISMSDDDVVRETVAFEIKKNGVHLEVDTW